MREPGSRGHRPRKRFGQHFLHDPIVIDKIVHAVNPQPGDLLLEIGPGLGAITLPLLRRAGRLMAVELDRDVIPRLQEAARNLGELEVIQADALDFDYCAVTATGQQLRLVGNLPYNISTPLLFRLLQHKACIRDMHFMLQKEVVLRMAAGPGGKDYGRVSVMLQAGAQVQHLFDIGRGAFRPPPRVESSFVRLLPHPRPPFPIDDHARFAALVAAAFSQRRKTLRNSLRDFLNAGQIHAAGIDPGARAETLWPAQFALLANLPGRE